MKRSVFASKAIARWKSFWSPAVGGIKQLLAAALEQQGLAFPGPTEGPTPTPLSA